MSSPENVGIFCAFTQQGTQYAANLCRVGGINKHKAEHGKGIILPICIKTAMDLFNT